ncbi:MAG: hypothetical protein ACREU4_05155 [Burkholderiales bacterium]
MSTRLDHEFPRNHWQAVPPIGPDGIQLYLERGRQLRAETFAYGLRRVAYGLRRVARALVSEFRTAAQLVRDAARGVARRPPQGDYATTASGRLTPSGG